MAEYINREVAEELLSEPITMSMCLSTDECIDKIAQRKIDLHLIKSIPAADVRPVVRGKWVFDIEPDMFRCSVCNGFAPRNDYPFCHWCGADMRGESDV